ncbi:MAG: hypothetical protein OHK0032_04320 [Thermodesulfovibrionales bacterium]
MIDKIWKVLTTLTEEAQNAAHKKCKELGFDPNRGIISLDESFINLNAARLILTDAIEKRKLIQLPITVQTTILSNLESISKFLVGLINGADEVVNLVNAIEQLNTAMWQYGLYNLSEEILGYQTKMNQLKNQELEIKKVKDELKRDLALKKKLDEYFSESQKIYEKLQCVFSSDREKENQISTHLTNTDDILQKANQYLLAIQKLETQANEKHSSIETISDDVNEWAKNIEKLAAKSDGIMEILAEQEKRLTKIIENAEQTQHAVENLLIYYQNRC